MSWRAGARRHARFERHVRPRSDRRPRPPLDAARARRGRRHRRPTQHPRVLTAVKARRCAPSASRLAALTPAPRALQTGNCPTMPQPDPARPGPDTRPSRQPGSGRWSVGGGLDHRREHDLNSSAAHRSRPDHDPNSTRTRSARSDPRTRPPTDENADGHQWHVRIGREGHWAGGRTRGEPGERRRRSGRRESRRTTISGTEQAGSSQPLAVMSQLTPCATWGWRGGTARPLRSPGFPRPCRARGRAGGLRAAPPWRRSDD